MEEAEASRYWCHMCSRMVNPVMESEIKCPICESGFVEEMASAAAASGDNTPLDAAEFLGLGGGGGDSDSDRAFSLWAPILLGMMGNPRRRRSRVRRMEFDQDDEDDENEDENENHYRSHNRGDDRGSELGGRDDLENIVMRRRRRRSSAAILQILQGIRAGGAMLLSETDQQQWAGDGDHHHRRRDEERMVLINPFNQTIIVQDSDDPTVNNASNRNPAPIGSLGDYFIGPGLDMLLQHLAENDPNRYGTPPAQKEAVEALPTVEVEETGVQCSVCLDDCELEAKVKEMPCKHKFHSHCILPWLELHSSCPICRYQLPCDESKLDSEAPRNNGASGSNNDEHNNNNNNNNHTVDGGDDRIENERQFSVPLPWPFSSLFSSSTSSPSGRGNSSETSPSMGTSRADEI